MTYKRFEDLPVWQAGLELARGIYRLKALPPFRRNRSLRYQIERAAVSVSNNIAEGFERGTTVVDVHLYRPRLGRGGPFHAVFARDPGRLH